MKAKTIAKTIEAKIDDWLKSIKDPIVQKNIQDKIVVTGGCITSMFRQETVNDYDVYLADSEAALKVAIYYAEELENTSVLLHTTYHAYETNMFSDLRVNTKADENEENEENAVLLYPTKLLLRKGSFDRKFSKMELQNIERVEMFVHSAGVESVEEAQDEDKEKEKEKYSLKFASSNAITLSNKVQIVLRFTGNPEEIHTNYDFIHTTNYWTKATGLVTNVKALESILSKELIYSGSLYPLASILRTRKFIQRGWTCHVGNYIKMALQLNELDLFDPDVLRDQLTGVDMAYMNGVISIVEAKRKTNPTFEFNAMYLCEVIDRLMGEYDAPNSSEA